MSDPLNALRSALSKGLQETDIENVIPIIVLRSYFKLGNWPGPYLFLKSSSLALTWTILHSEQSMVYVNNERQAAWEKQNVQWRKKAKDNLKRLSSGYLWTHEKRDEKGNLIFASMMHDDGLGSSRPLLKEEIRARLQCDYFIGIPDRSCAIIVPKSAGNTAIIDLEVMIRNMYNNATTPMIATLLKPEELEVLEK